MTRFADPEICFQARGHSLSLKFIPWCLAEFYYNRGLQRPHTCTCTILQETINRFLCPRIAFLKSETHQLNLKDVTELN